MGQNIKTLSLSNNGLYLINEESIYFATENKSYSLDTIDLPRWLDILSENSQFSVKHNLVEAQKLMDYHKNITLQLIEAFDFNDKVGLMLEYEEKFGILLLTESSDLMEGWIGNAWQWTKNKVVEKLKKFGQFAVKTKDDLVTCLTKGNCSPLFEDFRTMLFSPVGIAIETFLTVTGIGSPGPMIAWGIMLLWDVSLFISGDPNFSWLNLIFDVLGVGLGSFAKGARALFGGAKGVANSMGKSLTQVVTEGMRNPQTASILQKFAAASGKVGGIVAQAGEFLSKKMGLTWAGKVLNRVSEPISKIMEAIGVVGKTSTTKQGVKSALKMGAIAQGVTSGAEAIGRRKETGLLKSLQAAGPAEYVDGVDF